MKTNALMMDISDNVVTCVVEVAKGQQVIYKKGDELCTLEAEEDIPYCHKIALAEISENQEVIKYGEMIGKATTSIKKGCWVSHNNILSIPRDYDKEMI